MSGPLDKLLGSLRGVESDGPGKWKAYCPVHEDDGREHKPSLHITERADGVPLMHCFVCANSIDPKRFVAMVVHKGGFTLGELWPDHMRQDRGGGANGAASGKKKKRKSFPPGTRKVAEFLYQDGEGVVRYKVCRYELPDGSKEFPCQRPNGQGGWVYGLKGVEKIPYRLDKLLAAPKDQTIFVVEGEKKVHALEEWGYVATCNPGGAGNWLKAFAKYLRDRHVVILPDNDATKTDGSSAGRDHAREVYRSLEGIAKSVVIVELPDLPVKGDIVDWKAAGHTLAEFNEVIEAARNKAAGEAGESPSPAQSRAAAIANPEPRDVNATHFEDRLLADLGLDVLGELEGAKGAVKVFSESHRKTDTIDHAEHLKYERLLQIAGPIVKAKVIRGDSDDKVEGTYTMQEVRQAIALMAGFRRINEMDAESGAGVWEGIDNHGSPDNSVVLVGSGEAAKWNGDAKLHRIMRPRAGGRILDIGTSQPWYSYEKLAALVEAADGDFCRAAIAEAAAIFAKWRWKDRHQVVCPTLVVGLILATWVQTVWAWRPHVAIIGKSGSGKSTLFEALAGIFGRLAISSSGSTAAGIRQAVRQSARVILADEFEDSKHRAEILEMLRASSRGDSVLRGSTNQQGSRSSLRHMGWIAAIESGLQREPDRNRFVTLELLPALPGKAGELSCPPTHELADLGQRLLAVAIRHALKAKNLAIVLKAQRVEKIHPRVIESYAVPTAILATAFESDEDKIVKILRDLLMTVESEDANEGDERQLLDDILMSRATTREAVSVSQMIGHADRCPHYPTDLESVGISIVTSDRHGHDLDPAEHCIFFAHRAVTRHLLRGTRWEGQNIDQILSRLPGARKARWQIAGSRPWGIFIPKSQLSPADDGSPIEDITAALGHGQ